SVFFRGKFLRNSGQQRWMQFEIRGNCIARERRNRRRTNSNADMAFTEQDRQESQDLLVHIEEFLSQTDDAAIVNQAARRLAVILDCLQPYDEEALERKWSRF